MRPDSRNVAGWVMAGVSALVVVALAVVLARRWPLPALLIGSHSLVAVFVWLATDRGLREQNAGLAERHDAWNRQAQSTDLAEVGPIVPPAGTDRPIEVEPFMTDSGYRAPLQLVDSYPYPGRPEGLARRGISEAVMVNGGCVRCARDHEGFILVGGAWFALCDEHYAEVVEIGMKGA